MRKRFLAAVVLIGLIPLISTALGAQGTRGTGEEAGETDFLITDSGQIVKVGWARAGTAPTVWELMRNREPVTLRGSLEKEVPILVPERLQSLAKQPQDDRLDPLGRPFLEVQAPSAALSFGGYDSDDNFSQFGFRIAPPDTNGDVGLDYYVQYNNLGWKFFDKSDGSLAGGPFPGNIFWDGFGGFCDSNNAGDPIVLFDRAAQQWVFSQFTSPQNADGHQCFAVSTGSDPAGPYNLYDFTVSPAQFNDYPKIGVWVPEVGDSAYYMSTNEFAGGFVGVNVTAFDRAAMLAGSALSTFLQFTIPPVSGSDPFAFSLQPANSEDGEASDLPCGRFVQVFDDDVWGVGTGSDGYRFWDLCPDFDTPGNATFTELATVTTAEFDANLCGFSRSCIPVPSPGSSLDTLGQFSMYQFNSMRIDGTQYGVISHTVDLGSNLAGVRYAVFDMESGNSIVDTGTLDAGDGLHRWMPSAALDKLGNVAVGYTRANGSNFPSVYFTGREQDDPAGQLQAESVCINGTGVQTGVNRWGDYSSVSIDPDDECTFWVTNEYVETTGSFDWDTQICSFSFDSCTDPDGPAPPAWRMNSGGGDYVDGSGAEFEADKAFTVGDYGYRQGRTGTYTGEVAGTDDDALYLSVRGERSLFGYSFDIPDGEYEVTLYFVEMVKTGPGQRVFDVEVAGQTIDNLDIFARAGGRGIAHTETLTVNSTGGRLTVRLWPDIGPNAIISAVSVESTEVVDGPEIDVAPTSLEFGQVEVGDSAERTVTISNEGNQTLTVSSLEIVPDTSVVSTFVVSGPDTPFDILPGQEQDLSVSFFPADIQFYNSTLEITSNDADEGVVAVPLSGQGIEEFEGYVARINAAGSEYVDGNGHLFVADQAWVSGSFGYVGGRTGTFSAAVNGTDDDPLYQSLRGGANFGYVFDGLPPDVYEVRLYFNEAWFNEERRRIFEVRVEDEVVLEELDIFRFAGSPNPQAIPDVGKDKAYSEIVLAEVSDGQLNIDFEAIVANNALVAAIAVRPQPDLPLAGYTDVASAVGIDTFNADDPSECEPGIGTGSAWADFDDDGRVDVYLTNHGGPDRLYRNLGDTGSDGLPDFVDVAAARGVDNPGIGHSAVFIDYDNDGDQDLYVTSWGGNTLYENQLTETGQPNFLDVTSTANLEDSGRGITTSWADYDGDGDLDVYIAKHFTCMPDIADVEDKLYRNNGNGTFTEVTDYLCDGSAPCDATSGLGFAAGWLDWDNDGDLDLYLANDDISLNWGPNVLWRNDGTDGSGGWLFTNLLDSSEANVSANSMGLGIGDWNNDGYLDLAFSNIAPNNLLLNRGDGTYEDVASRAGVQRGYIRDTPDETFQQWTWGTTFLDHDNDGWLDLLYVAGPLATDRETQPNALYGNNRDGTFVDLVETSGLGVKSRARHAATLDFDEDGQLDVFVSNLPDGPEGPFLSGGAYRLFHNEALAMGNTHHWLQVTVEGTVSNRDAIGTRLWVTTEDGLEQMREIRSGATHGGGDQRLAHFGLGENELPVLTVRWPNGVIEEIGAVDPDQRIHLVEPDESGPAVAPQLER